MSSDLVTVGEFPNITLAAFARNRLEAEGIRAFVNEGANSAGLFGMVIAAVKLQVAEEDADRALDILEGDEEDETPDGAFTAEPPGPDPEDMEPEMPEEKPRVLEEADNIAAEVVAASPRDDLADRAFKATLIGLLLWPVWLYALVLLWQVYTTDGPMRDASRAKAIFSSLLIMLGVAVIVFVRSVFMAR